jgi:O-succinylbenzoic acid--CoA ligase
MFIPSPDNWPIPQTPYEADALAFCRAWQQGQAEFTLHTSGSTGAPKPIRLTRAQMQASALLTGQTLGLRTGDEALVCLNIRYVAGIMMLVRGLELGLPMTIIEPSGNPLAKLNSVLHSFAFTAFVPLQLQTILETNDSVKRSAYLAILNGMKAILVGGAATSPALEQALQVITAPVYATYGMTETVSHIALRRLNGPNPTELFTALDGVTLGTDERGCLHITAAATNFERVQTNDVVELIDAEHSSPIHFRLLGRADRIINSGGVKLQPEPIEQLIQTTLAELGVHPLPRLFVVGLPDERLGQRLVLVVEQRDLISPLRSDLQESIRQQLGPYAVPKEIITVSKFVETPTGKIDQKATVAQIH